MNDWTDGYMADFGYTYGYYAELNPLRVKLAFLNAGLAVPDMGAACELGFGQGISANIHAAASLTRWYGNDFHPSQASFAQEMAASSGAGAQLFDDAFDAFSQRTDLPDFDYIGLHGIWSWISDENRAVIVDFVRRKLKVGGVLYVSYNTLPGWAAFAPMRHLMAQHAEVLGSKGQGIYSRVAGALDFAGRLVKTDPVFTRANPHVPAQLEGLRTQNQNYVAHEYFNGHWQPMYFSTMAEWLAPAKVQFACSANYIEHVNALNLTADQQTLLQDIPDATLRQGVRDFLVNQRFRRDYWVKGERRLNPVQLADALRQLRVVLTTPRAYVDLKANWGLGEVELNAAAYMPVLDALADHQPKSLEQLEMEVRKHGIKSRALLEVMMVLTGGGHLAVAQDEVAIAKAKRHTDQLNANLIDLARGSTDVTFLASPVTGGGLPVPRFEQLFLSVIAQGRNLPVEWAQGAWKILQMQNQKLVKNGIAMETEEENLAELTSKAVAFLENRLPMMKALQIA